MNRLIGSTKIDRSMGTRRGRETDRLSALPDKALQRVLSHLVSVEAARTVALSRRWRDVYQGVPVVDLVDTKTGRANYCLMRDKTICFDQQVTSAILCKASTTPIQTFRLSVFHPPRDLLDQWIMTALSSGVEELDVELRTLCPFRGRSKHASADFHGGDMNCRLTKTPRQIFGNCSTLRRLRLISWTLDLPPPPGVVISSLESLFLARIMDPDGLLQQLLSSCPRLVHLALEECQSAEEITVASAHLQSFAMVCCHRAARVVLHSRRLRSLRYRGGLVPDHQSSLFEVANCQCVVDLRIEICQELSTKGSRASREMGPVTDLIRRCTNLTRLHLSLRPSMASCSSLLASAVRRLPRLRQLGLQCRLHTVHAVRSVAVLLRDARNLQVLSLLLSGPPEKTTPPYDFDLEPDADEPAEQDDDDDRSSRVTDHLWRMSIGCLDHTLLRINIVNYRGRQLERMVAMFLLSNGAALEEFSVTLWPGYYENKQEIAKELRLWRSNRRTRVTCKTLGCDDPCIRRVFYFVRLHV